MRTHKRLMRCGLSLMLVLIGCHGDLESETMQDQREGGTNDTSTSTSATTSASTGGSTAQVDLGGSKDLGVGSQDQGLVDMAPEADMAIPPRRVARGNEIFDQASLFTCKVQTPGSSPKRLRRIHNFEWLKNTISSEVPLDVSQGQQYGTQSEPESIDEVQLELLFGALDAAAMPWMESKRSRVVDSAEGAQEARCIRDSKVGASDETCIRTFVTFLLERGVLYRPASRDEIDDLAAFAKRELELEVQEGTTRGDSIRMIVSAAWLKGGALFRPEFGQGEVDEHGRRKLSDWELAQAISYALGGRAPGSHPRKLGHGMSQRGLGWTSDSEGHFADIRQAAIDGTISTDDVIRQLVQDNFAGKDLERRDLEVTGGNPWRSIDRRGEYWMARGLTRFFRQWLGYMELPTIIKDSPAATSKYDGDRTAEDVYNRWVIKPGSGAGYEATFVQQMDDMIARIVAQDKDVVANLFSSRTFFTPATALNGAKAKGNYVYGVEVEVESAVVRECRSDTPKDQECWQRRSQEEQAQRIAQARANRWQTLDPSIRRAGVLTHPAWLGAHALAFENDPNVVHRGKWVREKILCQDVPDLPITVNAAFDPDTRDQSARQRMMEQVDERRFCKDRDKDGKLHEDCPQEEKTVAYCQGCHTMMNPLGYPFEIYNQAGFLRQSDHGAAPSGQSVLVGLPEESLNGPVEDAVEMSLKFSQSRYVKRCFIRQSFRYFMGRQETKADACTLTQMEESYDMSQGSMSQMLTSLFQSDTFQYRTQE